jgi:hypothetical protein
VDKELVELVIIVPKSGQRYCEYPPGLKDVDKQIVAIQGPQAQCVLKNVRCNFNQARYDHDKDGQLYPPKLSPLLDPNPHKMGKTER